MLKRISKVCFLFIFSFYIFFSSPFTISAYAKDLQTSAKSAALICAESSQVIYSKNMDEKLSMASTTKIMTALIALEEAATNNKEVTITQDMLPVEGSTMGLRVGYKLTLYALAQGMLLISGNDAAHCAAIAIAGSTDEFAKLMNQKAKQIGMNNTNFVTPSGLDDENHYSTAYDMALLGAYAMDNDSFKDIASSKKMKVKYIQPDKTCEYLNSNRLLRSYDGCIGVKTGFTKKSGRCLVTCAQRDGKKLIAVTLNDPNDWKDHSEMFDYGFENCKSIYLDSSDLSFQTNIVGSPDANTLNVALLEQPKVTLISEKDADDIQRVVNLPQFVYAPVKEGDILGEVEYKKDGKTLACTKLIAKDNINSYKEIDINDEEKNKFSFLKFFSNKYDKT